MQHNGYKCFDYTVYPNESDGSIDYFGEKNINKPTKIYETLFTLDIYKRGHNAEITQDLYHYLRDEFKEMYKALNVKKMLVMRANCTVAAKENYRSAFHVDINKSVYEGIGKTAIFYLNTNNGYTYFEGGERVDSVENRIVIFPTSKRHAGTTNTDADYRCVINLNWF